MAYSADLKTTTVTALITYTYERNILLTKITVTNAQNTVIYSQDYSYDTPGKMTGTQHSNYFGSYAAGHPSANVRRDYSYTAKDELAAVRLWSQPKYGYSYDANGNHKRYETAQNNGYTGDNMVIDTNEDKILQKTNKDGSRTGYSYDAMGNLTTKMVYVAGGSVVSQRADYVYNYQDQLSEVRRNGEKIASYGYDTKRQRVYRQVYPTVAGGSAPHDAALREAKDGRLYMWNSAGRSIGEAEATTGRIVVRYVYSGNEKVAMERVDAQTGARSWYYFVNNAQGTPVLILDESGGTISRVNLDEWGNVGQLIGPASEVNYTGKKLDPETGLYYFNQRYYDPSLGRFLTEDPAKQGLNPYAYAGNSPLMYVDPDGEWFFEIGVFVGAAYGALIGGTTRMMSGGDFTEGAVEGFILGAKIGGTIGAAADVYTGVGTATWNTANPVFNLAVSTYGQAWAGQMGTGYSISLRDGGNDLSPRRSRPSYEDSLNSDEDLFCDACGGGIDDFVPRYGNFGGPGWTGGNEYPHKGPVDSMDQAFKIHDAYYDKKQEMYGDLVLLKELRGLNSNPAKWAMPPRDIPKAIHYRSQAIDYFSMKIYGKTGQIW